MQYIRQGTTQFQKANLALFAGGFVNFAILYCVQPLLPEFTEEFLVSPTTASLAVSLTTAVMAVFMLIVGSLSEAWGRKPVMTATLVTSSLLIIATALAPTFEALLVWRMLLGMVLAGLPAIAMAYLGEEMEPTSLGLAMGMYISGNSIGGMAGRFIVGLLTDLGSWRWALALIGVLSLLASLYFWRTLPASRNFRPRPLALAALGRSMAEHLKDRQMVRLFATGFLLMGSFVTLFNYIGFVLIAPPYELRPAWVGGIFIVYTVGTVSSTWMGQLAGRFRRRAVLWWGLLIVGVGAFGTLAAPLLFKIIGLAVFTFGFFGAHSIASSWVGLLARHDRAQASGLYLFFYYTGAGVAGTLGGLLWSWYGWPGIVWMIVGFMVVAMVLTRTLAKEKKTALS
ncbi:MFS transporter [Heliophilum fasciatum]|uniref:MFS transporter n=1 Tax=Heliophilum fasciatum TaxID=35700 RepID=UPI001050DB48|nr:MFS transporter [Heliophilum fasciatum]MCW2277079.1 YNFM family putative membrane transporter [Heliophilum fasciatum]